MGSRDSLAPAEPPEDSRGEVAIEMEMLYVAAEKASALTEELIEKLRPALNIDAFSTKDAEGAAQPTICPLATEIRHNRAMIHEAVVSTLAGLLQFIEL